MRPGYRPCSILTEPLIPPSFSPYQSRRFSSSHVRCALAIRAYTQNCKSIFSRIPSNTLPSASGASCRNAPQLLWLRYDAKIRLWRFPALRITPLRLLVGDRTGDNYFFAWFPIDRRGHLVLRGQLQRIDHPEHLVEVSARRHRVGEHELDLLVWADDVNVAHGRVIAWLAGFGIACGIGWEHPVQLRNVEISVADNWVIRRVALRFLDVRGPSFMIAGRIDGQSDDLHVSAVELWLDPRHIAEFGRADRGEVLRVGEQDGPGVVDPVMEVHPSLSGFCLEVWCCIADF